LLYFCFSENLHR